MHRDGHGGTHWHVAVTNGNHYYADGEAIYNDPCPGYNKMRGLLEQRMVAATLHRTVPETVGQVAIMVIIIQTIIHKITAKKKWL